MLEEIIGFWSSASSTLAVFLFVCLFVCVAALGDWSFGVDTLEEVKGTRPPRLGGWRVPSGSVQGGLGASESVFVVVVVVVIWLLVPNVCWLVVVVVVVVVRGGEMGLVFWLCIAGVWDCNQSVRCGVFTTADAPSIFYGR